MNESTLQSQSTAQDLTSKSTILSKYKVAPNGILARIYLAFLTTAGIYYINIMPAVVSGLKEGLGFSNLEAGLVSSANLYGAAVGAFCAVFIIKKIDWTKWCYGLLFLLIAIDFSCIYIEQPNLMIAVRAIHGLVGGLSVGIGFGIISRTTEADKTFGYLLFIQWGLGGLGLMYLPGLVPAYGTSALFLSLVFFSVVTLFMLPFLPHYAIEKKEVKQSDGETTNRSALLLTLLAIFLFQGANMGLFAYMIGLGKFEGLTTDFMSPALASASWIALLGAFLVMLCGTKFGRTFPLLIGIGITAFATWALHFSELPTVYLVANIVIGITWAFVLPYLFGICSALDKAGQLAAVGGFASKMGLASGPIVAALLLGEDNYAMIINVAAMILVAGALVVFRPAWLLDKN